MFLLLYPVCTHALLHLAAQSLGDSLYKALAICSALARSVEVPRKIKRVVTKGGALLKAAVRGKAGLLHKAKSIGAIANAFGPARATFQGGPAKR